MVLLAGLSVGIFVALGCGVVLGVTPQRLSKRTGGRLGIRVDEWLQQADAGVSARQLFASILFCAICGGLVVAAGTRILPLALVGFCASGPAPILVLSGRRKKRLAARSQAWPDAIRDLMTHLRAGVSLHGGLCLLADSGPVALRDHWDRYRRLASALDQRAALEVVREELADPMSDRVIEILIVALEQGAPVVVEVLQDLGDAATADLRLASEIQTAQLETKLEAFGAAGLPFVVLAMLCSTSDDYQSFYQSPAGWLVIMLGAALAAAGLIAISRLGRVPAEHRILAKGHR